MRLEVWRALWCRASILQQPDFAPAAYEGRRPSRYSLIRLDCLYLLTLGMPVGVNEGQHLHGPTGQVLHRHLWRLLRDSNTATRPIQDASLLTGISIGDEFSVDCVVHHTVAHAAGLATSPSLPLPVHALGEVRAHLKPFLMNSDSRVRL